MDEDVTISIVILSCTFLFGIIAVAYSCWKTLQAGKNGYYSAV